MITIEHHKTLTQTSLAKIAVSIPVATQMNLYGDQIDLKKWRTTSAFSHQLYRQIYCRLRHHLPQYQCPCSGLGHMTSNDCRQSATTITRELDPSMARDVTIHMNHSEATANKVYDIAFMDAAWFRSVQREVLQ